MNSLRRRIDRFCVLHPNFGIPNLMLYIVIGNIAFYLLSLFSTLDGGSFYSILSFSWAGLKQGQLWRLLSFSFLPMTTSPLWLLVSCYFYYWIGSTLERQWGTAKFTTYYLSGMLLTVLGASIVSLITGYSIPVYGANYVNFAMFMALTVLGGRRGLYTMLVYLLLGAVGIPVFSGFRGGIGVLLDTTGGYIIGFVAAALLYWLVTAKCGDSLPVVIAACVLGLAVCYAFGTAWFLVVYARNVDPIGLMTALGWCVFPYIIPDLAKLALAVILSRRVKKFLK